MFEFVRWLSIDAAAGRATGEAALDADHPLFADHFTGHPVLPGSMAVELAAQIAGPLAEEVTLLSHGRRRFALLGMIRNAKFVCPVRLPAELSIEARVLRSEGSRFTVAVTARVGRELVLRGELLLAMVEATGEWGDAVEQRRQRLARWQRAAEEPVQ